MVTKVGSFGGNLEYKGDRIEALNKLNEQLIRSTLLIPQFKVDNDLLYKVKGFITGDAAILNYSVKEPIEVLEEIYNNPAKYSKLIISVFGEEIEAYGTISTRISLLNLEKMALYLSTDPLFLLIEFIDIKREGDLGSFRDALIKLMVHKKKSQIDSFEAIARMQTGEMGEIAGLLNEYLEKFDDLKKYKWDLEAFESKSNKLLVELLDKAGYGSVVAKYREVLNYVTD